MPVNVVPYMQLQMLKYSTQATARGQNLAYFERPDSQMCDM
jgi:hypothetical protein